MFMFTKEFSLRILWSESEENAFYYILDFVAFKENVAVIEVTDAKKDFLSSEFTLLLSRGKLSHSPPEIVFLLCILFCY